MNFIGFRSHFIFLCLLTLSPYVFPLQCYFFVVSKKKKNKQKDVIDHWITDFTHNQSSEIKEREQAHFRMFVLDCHLVTILKIRIHDYVLSKSISEES